MNALISYKKSRGLRSLEAYPNATWTDVYGVLELCKKTAHAYKDIGKNEKYEYIINEPLTPTHERNYGMNNSKMTQEGVAWRLSCEYDNSIVIERLNMFDTASEKGQVSYRFVIKLEEQTDEIYKMIFSISIQEQS